MPPKKNKKISPLKSVPNTSLPRKEDIKESTKKWGKPVMDYGFCIIPSILIKSQNRLGLDSTQMMILLHLIEHWWYADRKPWPSKKTLASRLGIGARQVQRRIAEMEQGGLIKRVERTAPHRGKLSNEYDLSGLVKKIKELEPEFKKAREANNAVIKKGGLELNL